MVCHIAGRTQSEGAGEQNTEGYVWPNAEKGTGCRQKQYSEKLQGLNSAPIIIRVNNLRRKDRMVMWHVCGRK